MTISDNQLGMLEQLTYLDAELINKATGSNYSDEQIMEMMTNISKQNISVSQMLEKLGLTDEAIERLAQMGDDAVGFVECNEWASILKYIKSSDLGNLTVVDTSTSGAKVEALCFAESEDSSSAIVAFRGTIDEDEWIDNVQGLNTSDTEVQKRALDYIEGLPYDSITVTGHSKGANKAMYVAITSDKVDRCVAYDGQGFSQEFIDKYWAEIEARGQNITNYSLSTDYVHVLMFPVPNSNQVYCEGNIGVMNIGQHHSPNSMFVIDANGNLVLDENGNPLIVVISEDESMSMLHDFTTFVINNANDADKVEIVDFVSQLLAMVFGGGEMDTQAIIDYALENPDTLALIIAYLAKYMEVEDLSSDDINKLLGVLGLNSLNDTFGLPVAEIVNYAKSQLNDDDDDWITKNILLPGAKMIWFNDLNIDVTAFWEKINSKVKSIDSSGGCADATAKSGTIRDFSSRVYDALMNAISRIEEMGSASVSSWSGYSSEDWYSPLLIGIAIKGINAYFSKLTETNQTCKTRIDTVFNNVGQIDANRSTVIANLNGDLQGVYSVLSDVASGIG